MAEDAKLLPLLPVKPIIILPRGAMNEADIKRLNNNNLCVVEAEDPAKVRFLDPIPSAASRTAVEQAGIALSRRVLAPGFWTNNDTRQNMAAVFVDLLVKGTPLDPTPPPPPPEDIIAEARREELRNIGREEARAERVAEKAKKAAEAEKAAKQGAQKEKSK